MRAHLYSRDDLDRVGLPRNLDIGIPGDTAILIEAVTTAYNDFEVEIFDRDGYRLAAETYFSAAETPVAFVVRLLTLAADAVHERRKAA